jgi:hypothetical protein
MQKTQTYCDSCGRAKGETNNWFVLWVCYKRKLFSLVCFALLDVSDDLVVGKDICGQDCLFTEISKVIS